jgi:hypothetical protein
VATMELLSNFEAPDPVSEVLRAVRVRSTVYLPLGDGSAVGLRRHGPRRAPGDAAHPWRQWAPGPVAGRHPCAVERRSRLGRVRRRGGHRPPGRCLAGPGAARRPRRAPLLRRSRRARVTRPADGDRDPAHPPPPCCTRPTHRLRRSPSRSATAPSSPSPKPSSAPSASHRAPTAGSNSGSPGSVATPMPPCSHRSASQLGSLAGTRPRCEP